MRFFIRILHQMQFATSHLNDQNAFYDSGTNHKNNYTKYEMTPDYGTAESEAVNFNPEYVKCMWTLPEDANETAWFVGFFMFNFFFFLPKQTRKLLTMPYMVE